MFYYVKCCVKSLFSQTNTSFKEYLIIKSSKFKEVSFYNLYIFFARVKLLLVFEKGLVVRDCEYITISLLVSAEASTGDSVVGRVTHNYAHPSEYSPTCYYRRNAHLSRVLGGKGWRVRKSCSVHYSLIISAHSSRLFGANETKTFDSCSDLWLLRPCWRTSRLS